MRQRNNFWFPTNMEFLLYEARKRAEIDISKEDLSCKQEKEKRMLLKIGFDFTFDTNLFYFLFVKFL